MREQQQASGPLDPHQKELMTLADYSGVRIQPDVMKILIELLGMNVQPADLYQLLRDIVVRGYRANRANAKHSSRRSTTRTAETPGGSSCSGTPPQT